MNNKLPKSLFRYTSKKWAERLIYEGCLRFNTLSYYRNYEEQGVRGDAHESYRLHRPQGGLIINNLTTGQEILLPHSFMSQAKENDIYVLCMSTALEPIMYEKFDADACVEIKNPLKFLALQIQALRRRPSIKNKRIAHDFIEYYEAHDPPFGKWAVPEFIALSKLNYFSWQNEYRFCFAKNDAFRVENVSTELSLEGTKPLTKLTNYNPIDVKIGDISKFCVLHLR